MCTSNRDDSTLENTVKQSRFTWETWESFSRSELKLESVHQESPPSDIFRKRVTKPLLKQRHRQKHHTWAKEKKNWTVAQWSKVLFSVPRVWRKSGEAQNPCCTQSTEVQCEVSTVSDDLGYHVICWCWSSVFSEVHSQRGHLPGDFRALHASFYWQVLWRYWFHFWHLPKLPKVPNAGSMTMVLLCLLGQQTRLTWTP